MKSYLPHAAAALSFSALSVSAPASAEPYHEYLERLRHVCAVDCQQPRAFQRSARRNARELSGDEAAEMAVIMDVVDIVRVGDKFELHDMDLQGNPLEELAVLGSAGINTSSSNGIGGLSRSGRAPRHPNLIVIEFDEDTLYDVFGVTTPSNDGATSDTSGSEGLVVEGDRDTEVIKPSLASLRSYFRNRRIVVRGTPRLEAAWIGGRRDFRRKQVTLVVNRAEDIVLLPRYDENGEPILHDGSGG